MMVQTMEPAIAFWAASRVAAHALVRSGCVVATSYPGSPVVGIAEELRALDEQGLVQFRYATNEKIAFEMAAAAALAGQPAACVMKHVGLNVALDAVMGIAYTGVKAPLLLVVGDDPSCESSSTEQDSRQLAKFIGIPCIEPATVQELPEAIDLALRLSGEIGAAVMLRVTDELTYSSATMPFEPVEAPAAADPPRPPFREREYILLPAISRANRPRAIERLERARALGGAAEYVREEASPSSSPCTGRQALPSPGAGEAGRGGRSSWRAPPITAFTRATARLGVSVPVWRTLMPWPLNEERVLELAAATTSSWWWRRWSRSLKSRSSRSCTATACRRASAAAGSSRDMTTWTRSGRPRSWPGCSGVEYRPPLTLLTDALVGRAPTFCAGCPHTAFFFGFTEVVNQLCAAPVHRVGHRLLHPGHPERHRRRRRGAVHGGRAWAWLRAWRSVASRRSR